MKVIVRERRNATTLGGAVALRGLALRLPQVPDSRAAQKRWLPIVEVRAGGSAAGGGLYPQVHEAHRGLCAVRIAEHVDPGLIPPIGFIVANAGLQHTNDLTETQDGFAATFAVDVLAN